MEQQYLRILYQLLAFAQERNPDNVESEECDVKKQTDVIRDLSWILDPRIEFLKGILRHCEYVLGSYAKSGMFSRFENLGSFISGCNSSSEYSSLPNTVLTSIFMTEGRIIAEDKNEPLIKGHLSIIIQSITSIPVTGTCFTLELYNIWESRFLSKSGYTPHYIEWAGTEISLDYNDIDTRTEIELMIYENDNTQNPVGVVWLSFDGHSTFQQRSWPSRCRFNYG